CMAAQCSIRSIMARRRARFRNWAGTHVARPLSRHAPRSEAEVVELVRAAVRERTPLKVVGGAHSWTDIAATDGRMITLDALGGLVSVDGSGRMTVGAGIRLRALHHLL